MLLRAGFPLIEVSGDPADRSGPAVKLEAWFLSSLAPSCSVGGMFLSKLVPSGSVGGMFLSKLVRDECDEVCSVMSIGGGVM